MIRQTYHYPPHTPKLPQTTPSSHSTEYPYPSPTPSSTTSQNSALAFLPKNIVHSHPLPARQCKSKLKYPAPVFRASSARCCAASHAVSPDRKSGTGGLVLPGLA